MELLGHLEIKSDRLLLRRRVHPVGSGAKGPKHPGDARSHRESTFLAMEAMEQEKYINRSRTSRPGTKAAGESRTRTSSGFVCLVGSDDRGRRTLGCLGVDASQPGVEGCIFVEKGETSPKKQSGHI